MLKRTVGCPVISERSPYGARALLYRLTENHLGAALIKPGDSVIIIRIKKVFLSSVPKKTKAVWRQTYQSWKTSRVEPRETPPVPAGSVSVHIDSYFRQQEAFRKGCFFSFMEKPHKNPADIRGCRKAPGESPGGQQFQKAVFPGENKSRS